jgi:hypothetical protein
MVRVPQRQRDRSRTAVADHGVVDAHDGADLARRAGDEHLVDLLQISGGERRVAHIDADLAAHLEDEGAGDALEQPGPRPRRPCDPVPHQEHIRLRTLGQLAPIVAHQRFLTPAAVRLLHREGVVQQVVRLDDRVDRAGMVAQDRHERNPHALLPVPVRRGIERLDDDHHRRSGSGADVVSQIADAPREQDTHVGIAVETGLGRRRHDPREQLVVGEGDVELEMTRGVAQARDVTIVEKRHAVVGAQHLVDALTVHEAVIEHRDRGLVRRDDRTVHVHCAAHRTPRRAAAARRRVRAVSGQIPRIDAV